ncbi:CLUMA_CG015275, isoform A [Clunio marinus]|uniref:CLUMA_CG015275, isoform A n=1 Tax=Clunio marinus TaxID=568069 RepID=A0A1J1IS70_9DIPT|nr:CLUMA_CG015275, isoform A [Clunio marinus]
MPKVYMDIADKKSPLVNPFRTFDYREFLCGWGSAFVNITLTYPLYKTIFRQMLHGIKISDAYSQLRHEGVGFLYRGMFPPLAQRTLSLSLMFGVYDGVKRPAIEYYGMNEYSAKCLAGIIAGTIEAVLMPFERVQTILADAAYHQKYKNTPHAFRLIIRENGVRELYRGLVPILLRNGPSNAVFFVLREEAQKLPIKDGAFYEYSHQFISGAIIGAFVSSIFYPLNVIKIVIQSKVGGPNEGMFVALRNIYNDRGRSVRNVYKGLNMNCVRAFFSWGIMNAAYENFKKVIY